MAARHGHCVAYQEGCVAPPEGPKRPIGTCVDCGELVCRECSAYRNRTRYRRHGRPVHVRDKVCLPCLSKRLFARQMHHPVLGVI